MGKYQQQALIGSGGFVSGAQVGRQAALGTAEDAFRMPTSSIFFSREVLLHLAAIRPASHPVRSSSVIDGNDRFRNLPVFAAASMMLLGIVGSVAQQSADTNVLCCLFHSRQEARCVIAGTTTDDGREDEVAAMVSNYREFEKPPQAKCAARLETPIDEVATRIMCFQTGCIDAGFAAGRQQLEFSRSTNNLS